MSYRIEAKNKEYTGLTAGVPFVNGIATGVETVSDYFSRHHGYTVTEEQTEKPAATASKTTKTSTAKGAEK